MSQPVVYVSGPIRARSAWLRELNIRAAELLALQAWQAGAAVICPHSQGRFYDEHGVDWLRGDLAILARCDAVLVLPDWESSEGARREVAEARRLGLPVLGSLVDLIALVQARMAV